VAFENFPFFFKVNRDKVKLHFLQSKSFARIFAFPIFTPGVGAAKGPKNFPFFQLNPRLIFPAFLPH